MGDTFLSPEAQTESACYISNQSDIPLSATFNNILFRPDQKNLDLWIKELAPVYNSGVRVVTLPHTTWVSTGEKLLRTTHTRKIHSKNNKDFNCFQNA